MKARLLYTSKYVRLVTMVLVLQENYRMGGAFKWPAICDVLEYRVQVRKLVIDVIENAPLQLPITQEHPWVSE